ncbi:MAG: hypothetical protein IPJ14_04930 [Kineosporiaceae bacterium]|nr:hypothetical protein [Kineosporiaceae bacterium]MBK7622003.1 hypothetical protein [Kineosporiaceae bacterium]MBK8074315.1 hypothetical protein [Kineosporiaceae bacterium]
MDEARAQRVVAALRARGVLAQVERAGVYQFGVRVRLDGDRVAIWDSDGTASLEAQVMRNGVLVSFVPSIPGSQDFTEQQVVEAIATADYDIPVVTRPAVPRPPGAARPAARPAAGPAARPSSGGLLRRLFGDR